MAMFNANSLLKVIFKSKISQLIAVNILKRDCVTSYNPFKRLEKSGDQEDDSIGFKKGNDDFRRGSLRNNTNGYETRNFYKNSNQDLNRFQKISDDFEHHSDSSEKSFHGEFKKRFSPNQRKFGDFSSSDSYRNRNYVYRSDNYERKPRNTPNQDYYRLRKADLGKLVNGIGSESEWFARRNVQIDLPEILSGSKLIEQPVTVECKNLEYKTWNKFSEIDNLDTRLAEVLLRMGHYEMSPIQKHTYDIINRKLIDILGSAETGSGKTLAFLVPIFNNILSTYPRQVMDDLRNSHIQTPMVLVLAPTRELVQQIGTEAENLLQLTPIRVCNVIGGVNLISQMKDINSGCHVLIATPGRLIDSLIRGVVSLRHCTNIVIDEADRMLDMGFEPQINRIILESDVPKETERQTSLFSATFPDEVMQLARRLLKRSYGKILIGSDAGSRDPSIPKSIKQSIVLCSEMNFTTEVLKLLKESEIKTIVFCNRKAEVIGLSASANRSQLNVSQLHGDLTQRQRDNELEAFKSNATRVLFATSIAARGIDVADVMRVINYRVPMNIDEYVHRVGRCGRMGRDGVAITITSRHDLAPIQGSLYKVFMKCGLPIPDVLRDNKIDYSAPRRNSRTNNNYDEVY